MKEEKQIRLTRIDPDGLYIDFIIPGFWRESHPYDITVSSIGKDELEHQNKFNSMWHWIHHLRSKRWFDDELESRFIDFVYENKHLYKNFKEI